jgi:hypothetical protein
MCSRGAALSLSNGGGPDRGLPSSPPQSRDNFLFLIYNLSLPIRNPPIRQAQGPLRNQESGIRNPSEEILLLYCETIIFV